MPRLGLKEAQLKVNLGKIFSSGKMGVVDLNAR